MTFPIIIEDYNPLWPEHFEMIRGTIAPALDGLATAIEHIGSTAVPQLAAKPIIDIDVMLRAADDFPLVVSRLSSLGYEHKGDLGISGREAFAAPSSIFKHHLYICLHGNPEYGRHLAFRDYLRSHRESAAAYAALKRELADKFVADREAYVRAKSEFVEKILQHAR